MAEACDYLILMLSGTEIAKNRKIAGFTSTSTRIKNQESGIRNQESGIRNQE
jgi:hypothetical protein